ncbi:5-methylcytosine restriction system specificity protein McrC [Kocuria tytonicola]|uniref:5-methylcytosine restriction system specificity protein McrC n=1 Tax=Kocuria tytonicola TaxID=2055946 RepID=UPI001401DB09|nr:hypothetical protein [Kocuria tytonicola]
MRFFQASARGNGVGLTVLGRRPSAEDAVSSTAGEADPRPDILVIHILPKLWAGAAERGPVFRLPASTAEDAGDGVGRGPRTLEVIIHEQQLLALEPEWALSLAEVARDTLVDDLPLPSPGENPQAGGREAETGDVGTGDAGTGDTETGETDPLWREVPATAQIREAWRGEVPELSRRDSGPADPVRFLWNLLSRLGCEPARGPEQREPAPGGVDLLPDLPGLEDLVHRQFLTETERALLHRRPTFLPVTEELGFVRGRMDPQGLIRRTSRRRIPVLCEFDSLSADSFLWQTVRGAVQIAAAESADEETRELALTCDAQLRDVSLEPAHGLLSRGVPGSELQRMLSETQWAYRYARAVLARRHGVDPEESPDMAGVLVNLKYVTSALWEHMVKDYLDGVLTRDGLQVEEQHRLAVFFTEQEAPDRGGGPRYDPVSLKKPDLVVMRLSQTVGQSPGAQGQALAVLDAKYKRLPWGGFAQASMGDQYQLATYAYRLEVPAFLAYPVTRAPSEKDLESLVLGDPGATSRQATGSRRSGRLRVGAMALPFPHPAGRSLEQCRADAEHVLGGGGLAGLIADLEA